MTMTPQEYIEAMGAGWNLGSNYDGSWYDKKNNKYRYWCCNGTWQYKVNSGGFSNINVFKEAWTTTDNLQSFKFSFTPTNNTVDITIKHPVISATTETLPIKITSATVGGESVTVLSNALVFPTFSSNTSTLTLDLTTIFSVSALNKAVVLNVKLDSANLSYYPTSDSSTLSYIRNYIITRVISMSGFQDVKEIVIKAVKAAGFGSIRIPIMWYGHCDVLGDGHVHVDTEFLDHLATVLGWCHAEGLLVCINMHHDDNTRDMNGWLTTTQYLADPTVPVTYKDIWEQVATYFKDYGDWLSFASNNETLNDSKAWENPSTSDVWALKLMQKDFYDTVRSVAGNETRVCIYPTYAAKVSCFNSAWKNPEDASDTGRWGLPYDDAYGIAEIHPYAGSSLDSVRNSTKAAVSKGIPTIYGEFGNAAWTNTDSCYVTAYQVGYAKYFGQGTFIWDDDGGMRILNRRALTSKNYTNPKMWAGWMNNFIPSLTASAHLREAEILLNNRRQSAYSGDTVAIYLDTNKNVFVTNEGSSNTAIKNGNEVLVGTSDVDDLLAISYDGEYNTIDIAVDMPEHWIETVYDNTADWKKRRYYIYKHDGYGYDYYAKEYAIEIPINSPCASIKVRNSLNWKAMHVIEYTAAKVMIKEYNEQADLLFSSEPYYVSPDCRLVVLQFENPNELDIATATNFWVKITERDMSATEEKDRTASYEDSIVDYNNYYTSLYRTIHVSGGMEYQLNLGTAECDVYIREYNGDKLEADYWIKNGDTLTTNLFTKSMRLDIVVPEANISDVITAMNNGALRPTLAYTDYATHVPEYEEEFTPIPTSDSHGMVGIGNKILMYNGKCIKI